MKHHPLLEICVETLDAALAAERGGAHRLELCENLRVGGTTPSIELMRAVRAKVGLPIFAMIRPRAGDFVYSNTEFQEMLRNVIEARNSGIHGVVLGLLSKDGRVDLERTRSLVESAKSLPVTFHRAFDDTPDLPAALEDVIATGASRILTSGGKAGAELGAAAIAELVEKSRGRIEILAGGGITAENAANIVRTTGVREVHSGLSSILPYPRTEHAQFENEVRRLANSLAQI
jgi:copper homeostasis protein